ncbi:hypothetical protein VTN96DRAFT_4333 [Rasamsonia emersonii]
MSSFLIPSTNPGLSARVQDWLSSGTSLIRNRNNSKIIITSSILAVLSATVAPAIYRDYRDFISLGPGGVPHNVIGWLGVSLVLCPLGREMFSTEVYDRNPDKRSFLSEADVPRREGRRPVVGRHVVPQRQMDQIPGAEIKEKLTAAFTSLYQQNQHLVKLSTSLHESNTEALFLADGVRGNEPVATDMLREISHIHGTGDYSVHVTLPPQDCKKVIQAGWAQRHAFSGNTIFKRLGVKRLRLPAEYVLIYAPRNEEELKTVMKFVRASVAYLAGVAVEEVRM